MFQKHKTFDLDRERVLNQPKSDKLHQQQKNKYCKYLAIPAMIAFILLCILVNVDFTGEAYNYLNEESHHQHHHQHSEIISTDELQSYTITEIINQDNTATTTAMDLTSEGEMVTNSELNLNITAIMMNENNSETTELKSNSLQETTELAQPLFFLNSTIMFDTFAGNAKCVATISNCTLYCSGGGVGLVDEDLDSLGRKCPSTGLSLIIHNCEFYKGSLQNTIFWVDYPIKYVYIGDSNLAEIPAKTFQQNSLLNLQTLILRNNLLTILTASSFEGLESIKYFEFVQQPLATTFNGVEFLKPMSASLTDALITQVTDKQTVVNPIYWLQGSYLSSLITLDLSNNNFQDVLNSTTFRTLTAIENLILVNCSITFINEKVLYPIESTLKKLDLSNNYLQTFDLVLFYFVSSQNIKINLSGNEWYCDCEDTNIIGFFKENTEYMETIICYAPEKWQNMEMQKVMLECVEVRTTTTTTSPTITTTSSTGISNDFTTENTTIPTVKTTEDSVTNPNEISTPSEISTPGEISTPNEISTTTDSIPTSEDSSESTTDISLDTTMAPNLKPIVCYDSNKTATTFWFYHITFIISTTSASSVAINLPDSLSNFDIICFTKYPNYMNLSQLHSTISNNTVVIQKLISRTTYIFCLITDSQLPVSPLQCQAHYVGLIDTPWLLAKDKFWFITTAIIISLIFIIFAVFIVYVTLRKYPTLVINNSGKPEEMESSSNYLPAQESAKQDVYAETKRNSLYTSHHKVPVVRAPSLPPITENRKSSCPSYNTALNMDNASFYTPVIVNRFQTLNEEETSLYISQSNAPVVRAPTLPPSSSFTKSHTSFQYVDDDPDYQTIDHYEVINF